MDFTVVMNEDQVLALFIRICSLHSHHRLSGTVSSDSEGMSDVRAGESLPGSLRR